jgi:hypothetical protein
MTVKEMAFDLYKKFYNTSIHSNSIVVRHTVAIENSILCVNEILRACNQVYNSDMVHFRETGTGEWWLAVISEIQKLDVKKPTPLEKCGFCRGKGSVRIGASIHESCRHCDGSGWRNVV